MKGIEGSTLGRYELRRRVARGGMSEVYLGYDRRVRRRVAVKVLYGSDEPFVRRFEREALAVGALSHDHILALYDFGEQSPWYYLVMPFIEGGTLRDYLLKRERLTLAEAGSFLAQIADALHCAHEHDLVHRDVKPSNILLRLDGHAYLADFGLAKAKSEAEAVTHAGAMIGTPEYMAPEQSNGINDYRSDIYSLGILLYQMLTGRVPFTADSPVAISLKHIQSTPPSPRSINRAIPQSIETIILKALEKDPQARYQDALELAQAYQKALQEEQEAVEENRHANDKQEKARPAEAGEVSPSAVTQVLSPEDDKILLPPPKPQLFPLEGGVPFPYTQRNPWLRGPRLYFLLFALLGLILGTMIPLGLLWQANSKVNSSLGQSQSIQIPSALQEATATAQAQAQAQATLAAQARVQATAGITTSLGAGKVLYANDLTHAGGGWIDDGYQCFFTREGYHVLAATAHTAAWCYANQQKYADAVITAQAQLLRGDIYGVVFRLNAQSKSFYVLELNNRGEYRFVLAQGNNPLNWLTLIDWTHNNAILSGYRTTNTFLIVTAGNLFRFYINKQLIVSSFTDSTYSEGRIGFLVGGDSNGGSEAVFSNVWVFQK